MHPERIAKADKNMFNDLDYECIEFPVSKRDCIKNKNMLCYKICLHQCVLL